MDPIYAGKKQLKNRKVYLHFRVKSSAGSNFLEKKTEVNSQYSFEKKGFIYYLNACVDRLWRSDELMKNIYIYIIYIKYIFCCIVNKARG